MKFKKIIFLQIILLQPTVALFSLYSYGNDKENLSASWELLKLMIVSIFLITFTFDSRLIL